MIQNMKQIIPATPAEAHNSADGTGDKDGYFVILSGSSTNASPEAAGGLPVATLPATTATVAYTATGASAPSGVIIQGAPLAGTVVTGAGLPDQVALPGFQGLVDAVLSPSATSATTVAFNQPMVLMGDGSVMPDDGFGVAAQGSYGARWIVCRAVQLYDPSTVVAVPKQKIMVRLVEPQYIAS